jgi:hypothetical protein
MNPRQHWEPSSGWFLFLLFAMIGFGATYVTGQILLMLVITVLGALVVASIYGRNL